MQVNRSDGFVLPLVLIVLALLTVLSMGLSQIARDKVLDIQHRKSLWSEESQAYDLMHQRLYTLLVGEYRELSVSLDGESLPIDGRWVDSGGVSVSVQDAAGLFGLSIYRPAAFQKLLEAYTDKSTALSLAMELKDWVDVDNNASYLGLELDDYRAKGLPQRPRNAPIRSVAELLELPSMDESLLNGVGESQGLRSVLLAGGASHFNVPTAPDVVIAPILGLNDTVARNVIDAKNRRDWAELKRLLNVTHPVFDGYSPFAHGSRYIFIVQGEHRVRSQLLLTPHDSSSPFKIIEWQAPDYKLK